MHWSPTLIFSFRR